MVPVPVERPNSAVDISSGFDGSGMFGSIVGGLGGALISGAFQDSANRQNFNNAKDLMQLQSKLNREQAEWSASNLPALQMQGYRDAGLNPLLAVGGMSASSAQGVALGQSETGNVGQAMVEGARAGIEAFKSSSAQELMKQQVEVAKQQADTLESQENLNQAHALKTIQESVNSGKKLNADLGYIGQQIKSLKFDNKIKQDKISWYDDIYNPVRKEIGNVARYFRDNVYTPIKGKAIDLYNKSSIKGKAIGWYNKFFK